MFLFEPELGLGHDEGTYFLAISAQFEDRIDSESIERERGISAAIGAIQSAEHERRIERRIERIRSANRSRAIAEFLSGLTDSKLIR